jgi:ribonucleoside-diphosphate reductase alpha chain
MTEKYYWLNKNSRKFLERDYLLEGEDPLDRFKEIADAAERYLGIDGFSDKFLDYFARGFYSLSTPIMSNFGRKRGLPISCFGSYIPDSITGIFEKVAEVGQMTKGGGGTSGYFGDVRGRGSAISDSGTSTGSVHFMELFDKVMEVVSQGKVRRGSFAAYLPIDHTDIEEFLEIRGDGNSIQNLSFGVCISDEWMQKMVDGDKEARRIWGKVIKKRFESGYPYIFFTDTANNNAPQVYKDKGLKINNSNLCTEIMLSNSAEESFVCDLASLNAYQWEEIVKTDAVETLVYFLDAVMTEFINKTEGVKFMEAPRNFAINQRALGVGMLGWHSFLQSKMIPYESMEAQILNVEIWKTIRERADKATEELAKLFGEPPLLVGYGRRNSTTLAIAPNVSSSQYLGQVSPSTEPLNSNYFVDDLAKGKFTYKNPEFIKLLDGKGKNIKEVWMSILNYGGSVQHLDFLTQHEKDVYKTFGEISQRAVVVQAVERQPHVDQGQSTNLCIPAKTKAKEVSELMIFAWKQGAKSLYYQKGSNPAQDLVRSITNCVTCEA